MTINNQFIKENAYIVRTIVKQYHYLHLESDLMQEGYIGLIEAGRKFNPECGVLFESYAAWWVRKYIKHAIKRYGHTLSNPDKHPDDFASESNMDDVLLREQLTQQALNILSTRQRELVQLYFGIECDPLHVNEIARRMQLSVENVYKILERAIKKCKKNTFFSKKVSNLAF